MPNRLRPILLALTLAAAAAGLLGCGGDSGPDPSIPSASAQTLVSRINEIQDNVDVGSCLVAANRTQELLTEIDQLPGSVNQQVQNALVRGSNNLLGLLQDPSKCESRSATTTTQSTTAPTTTEETTTQKPRPQTTTTTPTQTQTTTPTQTQPNTTPGGTGGASGGIGPGGL